MVQVSHQHDSAMPPFGGVLGIKTHGSARDQSAQEAAPGSPGRTGKHCWRGMRPGIPR